MEVAINNHSPLFTLLLPIISGGLAGGLVSVISNRIFHWRTMRTKFYPVLNNMYSAYVIRMEKPEGRCWVNIVGQNPSNDDEEFVEHRSNFISGLVEFNELKEARVLRTAILDNSVREHKTPGILSTLDLQPAAALNKCMKVPGAPGSRPSFGR